MTTIKLNISSWGSGKTTDMYKSIKETLSTDSNVIVVGCSLSQLDTYYSNIKRGIICSSKKSSINVKSQLISALKKTNIVFCTGVAFSSIRASDSVDFENTVVFCDEVLNVLDTQEMTTKKSDVISIISNESAEDGVLIEGSFTINSIGLSALEEFKCPWKAITLYGANAIFTPFGRLLELSNIDYTVIREFEAVDLSDVKFLCPNLGGKKLTKSMKAKDPFIVKSMYSIINERYPKQKFVYNSNSYDPAIKSRYGIRMPHNVAGSNEHRDVNIMLMLSTLNFNPVITSRLCGLLECDVDYLTVLVSVSTMMQSVFRTSIRDDAHSGKGVVVADAYLIDLAVKYGFIKNVAIEYFDVIRPSAIDKKLKADKKRSDSKKELTALKKKKQENTLLELNSK